MRHVRLERPVVIVSPHLDDAILSCAIPLSTYSGTFVVTVFAGAPRVSHKGYNRRTTKRTYAPDAIAVRHEEDRAALAAVDAVPVWLDLLDADYAAYRPPGSYATAVRAALESALELARTRHCPLSLGTLARRPRIGRPRVPDARLWS